jgi:hypothetical protein
MVTEVSAGGLAGAFLAAFFCSWASPRAVVTAISRTVLNTRFMVGIVLSQRVYNAAAGDIF